MEQKKYINNLLDKASSQKKKSESIQRAYENYINSGSNAEMELIISELDEYCVAWVRRQLWKTGCYSDENEHTAMQESRLAAWKVIEQDKKEKTVRQDFTYYAFGVYKHKVLDEIRKFSTARKQYETVSLDEPIDDSGHAYAEKISSATIEDEIDGEEKRKLYEELFILYCRAFTEATAYPPRSLALYYARVLPHLLAVIPDNKASSAKWAFDYMTDRTLFYLKNDSERYLQTNVSKQLTWCVSFLNQIESVDESIDNSKRLGDVIYTQHFNKGKIEDWAEYMHKVCTKVAMKLVIENSELLETAKSYLEENDVLYKLVKGGHSR